MAVNCSWADVQALSDASICSSLPQEILDIIATKSGREYLDALAVASLRSSCTDRMFILYEPLIVEITARWLVRTAADDLTTDIDVFSGLARVLPMAPYLKPPLTALLGSSHHMKTLRLTGGLNLFNLTKEQLLSVLLAWFRLLTYDVDSFAFIISPLQLSSLLTHTNLSIRCLATQCISLQMKMSDSLSEKILANQMADASAIDAWEDKLIDYRWLKLFEEERWKKLEHDLSRIRFTRPKVPCLVEKNLTDDMLSSQTAILADILIPRSSGKPPPNTTFVHTLTTTKNLKHLAQALLVSNPILLMGTAGSGKTSLINEAARELNKHSSMITLHLNEQTDAKGLIGLYTISATGGTFVWQPGILTRAMEEGKWVVIEDIDRAPSEIMGAILPIINQGFLLLPNRRERIRAADGFRFLATMRRTDELAASRELLSRSLLGSTCWKQILVQELAEDETAFLLREKFAFINLHIDMILCVINRVKWEYESNSVLRNVRTEVTGLRTILKWCHRINSRLKLLGKATIANGIPEIFQEDIFLDALDCFAGHLPSQTTRFVLAECLGEEMHISLQRRNYCFRDRIPAFHETGSEIKLGRAIFPRLENSNHRKPKIAASQPFASTRHSRRVMESMLSAIMLAEPLLLVGETGIGKTTFVQHLARCVNQKLTVVNLSQQSESSDLLGGLKPITIRSLALPLVDTFRDVFEDTFSVDRNQNFQSSLIRCVAKQNWRRLLLLWQEAIKKASQKLQFESCQQSSDYIDEQPSKRRRLVLSRNETLRQRWKDFSTKVEAFSVQLSRGEKNFAFTFVEGKIVDAVRNGGWILFDEINLASPDTLDSIATLLRSSDDGLPFLLLPESGNLERVVGHPSLRIFAAMNPATDAGKKDLLPSLRVRFTELFVPSPDDDLSDLLSLVKSYLGSLLDVDDRAAYDLARLYIQIKKLNDENSLIDGAGDRPHFSIRSLVRCLMYVAQNTPAYGLRRAMYEGAAMSFLTVLNKSSSRIVLQLLDEYILSVKNARSLLNQIRNAPPDGQFVVFEHHWLQRGPLRLEKRSQYIITPFVRRNLLNLARAASMKRFPILMQGPTSSGKTSMVEYLAKVSGHNFVRINNHEHTDLQEYLGFYASDDEGKLQYREGILVQALRDGYWLVLDELNLAPTDVLEALNRLLDDNRELLVPESQEIIKPHPNFMLFATQNPAGAYGGRKRLSRAFRNRFLEIHFDDIPEDELEIILTERTAIAPSFCTGIVSVYKRLALLRQSTRLFEQRNSFVTLRDLFRWAFRRADDRQQLANNGFMLLAERVRDPAERRAVKSTIEDVFKVNVDDVSLYDRYPVPAASRISDGIVWTPAMKRLFSLISEAIVHNEPVLLIGETGCGKTQICQIMARVAGRRLQIYNAHANTETGDLIGAQRPTRNRAEIELQLREDIEHLLSNVAEKEDRARHSLEELIQSFEKADLSSIDSSFIQKIRRQIAHHVSLFEWVDGSLVNAMKDGDYFLLDEISLAEDSVLERLNSLLEPERTIFLAEKGSTESSVVAGPDFQFLATMNPGGDYGKRELSAALRNRFTEIWVPSLTDDQDILPILQSKLPPSARNAAQAMIDFAKWFKASFESSIATSISLRNLLSWSDFIQATAYLTAPESLVHGAAMVYIDTIGANPSGMISVNTEAIDAARQQCLNKLGDLLQYEASSVYHRRLSLEIGAVVRIGCFHINANPGLATANDFIFDAPTTLQNGMRIIRALQVSKAILLEGNPGAGKTALVTALARVAGKSLVRINLSDQTDLMDLFGADVPTEGGAAGSFSWRDGPLLQAMQSGAWVLLDEMNLASQSILEGLNSCLDHRQEVYISELDRTFQRHPNFMLFAAQNPHHKGGGRKGLPTSFINRFTVVYTEDFKIEDLSIISRQQFPTVTSSDLANVLTSFFEMQKRLSRDRAFQNSGAPWDVNLRDITRWLQISTQNHTSRSPLQYLDLIVGRRLRTTEQRAIMSDLFDLQPGLYPPRDLYHNLMQDSYQVGSALLKRNSAFSELCHPENALASIDLPAMEALMLCVSQAWPGTLVGPAGCGKLGLLRYLAATIGTTLIQLPMNADTDIIDLIGGFEQYDAEYSLSALRHELCQIVNRYVARNFLETRTQRSWRLAMDLYERLVISQQSLTSIRPVLAALAEDSIIFAPYLAQVNASLACGRSSQVKFQWIDGVLIEALERGYWVVLENANLCSASVLDRLNSLLEPNGSLMISEQHNLDGQPRLVKPHKDFRIFLTLDPRHGELSPAMRNRTLEIHMQRAGPEKLQHQTLTYSNSSAMSRIRLLLRPDRTGLSPELQIQITRISLGHFSVQEHMNSHRWQPSLSILLTNEGLEQITYYQCLPRNLLAQVLKFYTWLSSEGTLGECLIPYQPIRPILNRKILSDEHLELALALAWLIDSFVALSAIQNRLENTATRARNLKTSEMTILELSFHADAVVVNGLHKPQRVAASLKLLERAIHSFLCRLLNLLSTSLLDPGHQQSAQTRKLGVIRPVFLAALPHYREFLKRVLDFFSDFIDLTSQTQLEAGAFQVYIQIGQKLAAGMRPEVSILSQGLSNALMLLEQDSPLRYGRSLLRMWDLWRSITASTSAHLQQLHALERVADRFDELVLRAPNWAVSYADVRVKLLLAWEDALRTGRDTTALVQSLELTVEEMQSKLHISDFTPSRFFSGEFEYLCQTWDLYDDSPVYSFLTTGNRAVLLQINAGRKTRLQDKSPVNSPVPGLLSKIAGFGGSERPGETTRACQGTFIVDLALKLNKCRNQPLGSLNSLMEDMAFMIGAVSSLSPAISSCPGRRLKSQVIRLLQQIFYVHKDLFESDFEPSKAILELTKPSGPVFREHVEANHYFRAITSSFLKLAATELAQDGHKEDAQLKQAGCALFRVCIAMLYLFVPDQLLDPSLSRAIDCEIYDRRLQELVTKLEALQIFEKDFSGGTKSIDMELIVNEISALGKKPLPPSVARPQETELPALFADFKNMLSVITESSEHILSGDVVQDQMDEHRSKTRRRQASLFQQNITRMVQRFSNSYRAYEDLTVPVIRTLQCLNLAIDLAILRDGPVSRVDGLIDHLSLHTPFLGGNPVSLMGLDDPYRLMETCSMDIKLSWLDHIALRHSASMSFQDEKQGSQRLLTILDIFYREWKMQLTKEQQLEARQSKYYSYLGEDEDGEAMVQAQMQELFPDFSADSNSAASSVNDSRYEPKAVAIKMANCLTMFNASRQHGNLEELVLTGLELVQKIAKDHELEFCHVASENMLPGAMLLMHQCWESLKGAGPPKTMNIYTDADSAESRKISDVVRLISGCIEEAFAIWPEHALLHNIRVCCREILRFKISDPLAKILTKAEKLHQLTSEWQALASREFAVTSPLNQLTNVIVSWRKLELKSWEGLLDLEKQKCLDDARSWFFVAYEAIVAIPIKMMNVGEDIVPYVDDLVTTLESFLKHTASGQFAQRLQLVEELCYFISKLDQWSPTLLNLTSSITNLLQHQRRYTATVDNNLKEGVTKLVQEVENQILTARWKDKNIIALRDSASRSHKKLFKIVRKYRALLLQPIKETFSPATRPALPSTKLRLRDVQAWGFPLEAGRALEICQNELPGWPSRPRRLQNSLAAAASMRHLYLSKNATFNPHEVVGAITGELSESIQELKALTPSRQNEDNKGLVQHLKTRKRRLLADVLRDLRHMGVRRNLSGDELREQSSTACVLSATPCIVRSEDFMDLSLANDEFHDLLDYMPQIRAKLQEHSDDLTGSEVNRCVGLTEGLLLVLRKQRASLSPILASLNRLHLIFRELAKLQRDGSNLIVRSSHARSSGLRTLMQQLHWLPDVLNLSCKLLKIHAQHTMLDVSSIVDFMELRSNVLRDLYFKLREESSLLPGFSTQSVISMSHNAHEMIVELRQNILDFTERQPHTVYLLKQVLWWTEFEAGGTSPHTNGTNLKFISNFDQSIREATDKIFVALQRVAEVETMALRSPKDASWLTRTDSAITSSMNALHIEKVALTLENALQEMSCIDDTNMMVAISLAIVVTPIIEQFYYICSHIFQRYIALHYQISRYSNVLARAFISISSEGFCSPLDDSTDKQEQSGQIEQGTGLGDGDGAEDIGKDIGEDEDLSELAQNPNRESEQHKMSDVEDAIDMADAELEGDVDDFGHGQDLQEERDAPDHVEESGNLEEETGSIDDLDPSAVDEKLWNDLTIDNEKEVENKKNIGTTSDEQAAGNEKTTLKEAVSVEDSGEQEREGEEASLEEEEEEKEEALDRQEQNRLDPYVQEEQILGLPEDMKLDGDKDMEVDTVSNDGLDEFSNVEDTEVPEISPNLAEDLREGDTEDELPINNDPFHNAQEDLDGEEELKGELAEDQLDDENEYESVIDGETHINYQDEEKMNTEDAIGEDIGIGIGRNQDTEPQEHKPPDEQARPASTRQDHQSTEDSVVEEVNETAQNEKYGTRSRRSDVLDNPPADAFKKMGDILDQWHERREVIKPFESLEKSGAPADIEMNDADLEHVKDDADQGNTQAIDAATKDQARALDQSKALIEDDINPDDDDRLPDADEDSKDTQKNLQSTSMVDFDQRAKEGREHSLDEILREELGRPKMQTREGASSQAMDELVDLHDVGQQFSAFQLTSSSTVPLLSLEEASRLWTNYSSSVHSISLLLTEQLRLILAPTLATKLRGDFRTGKRLNIKRIIPYIASGYKRDKIWMRRSVPSKRNYQIMIAVDNSKSMIEGGAGALALESLALMCKSLSTLEVGEICVVGFGDEDHIRIAQPFAEVFTSESGPRIFRHFNFQQTVTDVRKLIAESIHLFRDARAKSARANADLWQLELIISDGICEDHDTIRRLVRQAAEERIMIVFIIVDSANVSGSGILDLQKASYESDGAGGEPKLTIKRYLDEFPFPYYLIVRDVRDLPGILAIALKGWFAQVVDVQG